MSEAENFLYLWTNMKTWDANTRQLFFLGGLARDLQDFECLPPTQHLGIVTPTRALWCPPNALTHKSQKRSILGTD